VIPAQRYLLAVLTSIMVFNYVDRVAMGLLLQSIKLDLALSDTQLGLLTGIAFAAFYATMGIPIARWADRGNRVTIISVTVGVWSAAVALCGMAGSFVQLLLMRMVVAVGEAGCHPPAFSLIADYFSRADRPRAVARYMLGWPLALLIGFFAGGWLNQALGWRATFVILGLPGLLLAVIAAITLKEPRRLGVRPGESAAPASNGDDAPALPHVLRRLWSAPAYRHLLFAFSLSYFFGNGILQWLPAFFARSHGLDSGIIGTGFAVIYGLGGLFGTWLGGELAARHAADDERLQLAGLAVLYVLLALLGAGVYLASSSALAFTVLAFSSIGNAAVTGPMFAATQTLVPPQMRALSIAIVLFFSNLIGLGLGPLAAGALSDALRPQLGEESLRYALLALCPGYFWCAWHLWRAGRAVAVDQQTSALLLRRGTYG
jgi:predicted MFS family arabinose efflux permease